MSGGCLLEPGVIQQVIIGNSDSFEGVHEVVFTQLPEAMDSLTALPTPDHITLLLKRHKSTVAISVLPNSSFTDIKQTLLAILKSRNLTTFPGSQTKLPETAEDIEFGILKDRKDPSKGWISLDTKLADLAEPKSGKRKTAGKPATQINTPGDAGMVDGSLVAYRSKTESPQPDDNEDEMMDVWDSSGWDVVLPMYEDDEDEAI